MERNKLATTKTILAKQKKKDLFNSRRHKSTTCAAAARAACPETDKCQHCTQHASSWVQKESQYGLSWIWNSRTLKSPNQAHWLLLTLPYRLSNKAYKNYFPTFLRQLLNVRLAASHQHSHRTIPTGGRMLDRSCLSYISLRQAIYRRQLQSSLLASSASVNWCVWRKLTNSNNVNF